MRASGGTPHAADSAPKQGALPGTHEAARRLLRKLPKGRLVELGAGHGAMSDWARNEGFDVTALDVDPRLFEPAGIAVVRADLNRPFPLDDRCTDVVVAIEVIEHLENLFAFFREVFRILKSDGHVVFSTPNEHNLESRWSYFVSGFYENSREVIHEDDPELSMRHINLVPLSQLEFAWRRAGLCYVDFEVNRCRRLALLLLPMVYPLQTLTLRNRLRKVKDPHQRRVVSEVHRLINDKRLVTGRVVAFLLRKPRE